MLATSKQYPGRLMEAFTRLHAQAEEGGSHNTGAIIAAEEMELRLKQLPKESR